MSDSQMIGSIICLAILFLAAVLWVSLRMETDLDAAAKKANQRRLAEAERQGSLPAPGEETNACEDESAGPIELAELTYMAAAVAGAFVVGAFLAHVTIGDYMVRRHLARRQRKRN